MRNQRLIHNLIRGIVASRGEDGATIAEIREDYTEIVGEHWGLDSFTSSETETYLANIYGLSSVELPTGALIYFIAVRPMLQPVEHQSTRAIVSGPSNGNHVMPNNVHSSNLAAIKGQTVNGAPKKNLVNSCGTLWQNNIANGSQQMGARQKVANTLVNNPPKPPRCTFHTRPTHVVNGNIDGTSDANNINLNEAYIDAPESQCSTSTESAGILTALTKSKSDEIDVNGNQATTVDLHQHHGPTNHDTVASWSTAESSTSTGDTNNNNASSMESSATSSLLGEKGYVVTDSTSSGIDVHTNKHDDDIASIPISISPTVSIGSLPFPGKTAVLYHDCEIMGDDFFLELAKTEFHCIECPSLRPRRCGLCASGQTVEIATDKVLQENTQFSSNKVIINLGTMDILQPKHQLMDIKYKYEKLLDACRVRHITPIITTLAPLQSGTHDQNQMLRLFNQFLITRFRGQYCVIDLYKLMVNSRNKTCDDLYQPYKITTHTIQKHRIVLWNQKGRQRILDSLKKCITY